MFFNSWNLYINRVGFVKPIAKMIPWGDKSSVNLSKVQIEYNKKKKVIGNFCWESSKPPFTKIFKQILGKPNQLRIISNISVMTLYLIS